MCFIFNYYSSNFLLYYLGIICVFSCFLDSKSALKKFVVNECAICLSYVLDPNEFAYCVCVSFSTSTPPTFCYASWRWRPTLPQIARCGRTSALITSNAWSATLWSVGFWLPRTVHKIKWVDRVVEGWCWTIWHRTSRRWLPRLGPNEVSVRIRIHVCKCVSGIKSVIHVKATYMYM